MKGSLVLMLNRREYLKQLTATLWGTADGIAVAASSHELVKPRLVAAVVTELDS